MNKYFENDNTFLAAIFYNNEKNWIPTNRFENLFFIVWKSEEYFGNNKEFEFFIVSN